MPLAAIARQAASSRRATALPHASRASCTAAPVWCQLPAYAAVASIALLQALDYDLCQPSPTADYTRRGLRTGQPPAICPLMVRDHAREARCLCARRRHHPLMDSPVKS